jgi:hypothetical protein
MIFVDIQRSLLSSSNVGSLFLLILVTLLPFSGCVLVKNSDVKVIDSDHKAQHLALEATVRDEVYDGQQLSASVLLKVHDDISVDSVAVRLRLLRDGQVLSDQLLPLKVLLDRTSLESNEEYIIPLLGSAENLTDYQVELIWGSDAIDLLRKEVNQSIVVNVKETSREDIGSSDQTNCRDGKCLAYGYKLKSLVEVINSGKVACSRLAFKVSLEGENLRVKERIVRLKNPIDLKPGASRLIRLNFQDVISHDMEVKPLVSVLECM